MVRDVENRMLTQTEERMHVMLVGIMHVSLGARGCEGRTTPGLNSNVSPNTGCCKSNRHGRTCGPPCIGALDLVAQQHMQVCTWCDRPVCERHGRHIAGRIHGDMPRWQCDKYDPTCWQLWQQRPAV